MKKQTDNDPKDELTQADIKNNVKTFEAQSKPHPALETPEGKNNGAKPSAYKHQRSSST